MFSRFIYIFQFVASSPYPEIDHSFGFWPNDVIHTFSFDGHKGTFATILWTCLRS